MIRVQAAACFESENRYASLAFDYWKFYEHKGPINKHHKKNHDDDIAWTQYLDPSESEAECVKIEK